MCRTWGLAEYFILTLMISYGSIQVSGQCSPPAEYTGVAWFQFYMQNPYGNWIYGLYSSANWKTYRNDNSSLMTTTYTCQASTMDSGFYYYLYSQMVLGQFCAKSRLVADGNALLVSEVQTTTNLASVSDCLSLFTTDCYQASGTSATCSAVWKPKTPLGKATPSFTPAACPFQGDYQLTVSSTATLEECAGNVASTAAASGSSFALNACDGQAANSTYKERKILRESLTCLAYTDGSALTQAEVDAGVSILLLVSADNATLYCARYRVDGSTVTMSIDVQVRVSPSCGYSTPKTAVQGKFLSLTLQSTSSTLSSLSTISGVSGPSGASISSQVSQGSGSTAGSTNAPTGSTLGGSSSASQGSTAQGSTAGPTGSSSASSAGSSSAGSSGSTAASPASSASTAGPSSSAQASTAASTGSTAQVSTPASSTAAPSTSTPSTVQASTTAASTAAPSSSEVGQSSTAGGQSSTAGGQSSTASQGSSTMPGGLSTPPGDLSSSSAGQSTVPQGQTTSPGGQSSESGGGSTLGSTAEPSPIVGTTIANPCASMTCPETYKCFINSDGTSKCGCEAGMVESQNGTAGSKTCQRAPSNASKAGNIILGVAIASLALAALATLCCMCAERPSWWQNCCRGPSKVVVQRATIQDSPQFVEYAQEYIPQRTTTFYDNTPSYAYKIQPPTFPSRAEAYNSSFGNTGGYYGVGSQMLYMSDPGIGNKSYVLAGSNMPRN